MLDVVIFRPMPVADAPEVPAELRSRAPAPDGMVLVPVAAIEAKGRAVDLMAVQVEAVGIRAEASAELADAVAELSDELLEALRQLHAALAEKRDRLIE